MQKIRSERPAPQGRKRYETCPQESIRLHVAAAVPHAERYVAALTRAQRSRRLLTRDGLFSPSLEGGLPLLLLFSPSRRSNSAMRACITAISAA